MCTPYPLISLLFFKISVRCRYWTCAYFYWNISLFLNVNYYTLHVNTLFMGFLNQNINTVELSECIFLQVLKVMFAWAGFLYVKHCSFAHCGINWIYVPSTQQFITNIHNLCSWIFKHIDSVFDFGTPYMASDICIGFWWRWLYMSLSDSCVLSNWGSEKL